MRGLPWSKFFCRFLFAGVPMFVLYLFAPGARIRADRARSVVLSTSSLSKAGILPAERCASGSIFVGRYALAGTRFLLRGKLIALGEDGFGQISGCVFGQGQLTTGVGQQRRSAVCLPKAKCGGQIAKNAPPPTADVRLPDAGELLQGLEHRRMVEGLTAYPTAARPRRYKPRLPCS